MNVFVAFRLLGYREFLSLQELYRLSRVFRIWIRSRVTKDYSSLRSSNPKYSRPRLGDPEGPRLRLSNPCIPSNGKGRKCLHTCGLPIAGIQGFEPRYSGPKPDVLPLDDIPIYLYFKASVLLGQMRSKIEVYLHFVRMPSKQEIFDFLPLDDIPIFSRQFVTWPIDYHNLPKKSAP